ncbi:hypothetical protein [Chlorobium phaeobacteroides]|uniref:Uncharacterized protein n=1 Tax=Chlorobium phaeobacteroides (strain DSM 266 / SMG 266 / 2430) TaxID=290317 RepID=A1BCL2_CHLPD|nr:hypothetical protein [Chlorobium phaeobacteroides]ABL64139.1 hypothetical protein Cpha266_0069 [Chlorobium phaeobacteroides DSM 266]
MKKSISGSNRRGKAGDITMQFKPVHYLGKVPMSGETGVPLFAVVMAERSFSSFAGLGASPGFLNRRMNCRLAAQKTLIPASLLACMIDNRRINKRLYSFMQLRPPCFTLCFLSQP